MSIFSKKYRSSAIKGCIIGGAVGDALGYPVESMYWKDIQRKYGADGIRNYELDWEEDMALISDDTQMSLFTANGLLLCNTRNHLKQRNDSPIDSIYDAYRDWYYCQKAMRIPPNNHSFLSDLPEMHVRRAPGTTCMTALAVGRAGSIGKAINSSKGNGGVMRVAPIALWNQCMFTIEEIDLIGAQSAALTHGHPLAYIPAAALVHIISKAACTGSDENDGLYGIVEDCRVTMKKLFRANESIEELLRIIDLAVELSVNDSEDVANIESIGGGWTGTEALGIAIYCSLKYSDDFSKGIIAAVNHGGDSDSTGAITGNILGAWLGYEAIEDKWLRNLELKGLLSEMANDLYIGYPDQDAQESSSKEWNRKYMAFLDNSAE